MIAENYAHEFMMLGYSSKKVLSLFTSTHFKSANAVYNILGLDETNKIIAKVFGQGVAEVEENEAETSESTTQENKEG